MKGKKGKKRKEKERNPDTGRLLCGQVKTILLALRFHPLVASQIGGRSTRHVNTIADAWNE